MNLCYPGAAPARDNQPSPYIFSGHSPTKTQEQSTIPSPQEHPKKPGSYRIGSNHNSSAQIPKSRRKPDYRVSVLTRVPSYDAPINPPTTIARRRRPKSPAVALAGRHVREPPPPEETQRARAARLPTITCQLAIAAASTTGNRAWRPAGSRPRTRARGKASKLTGKSGVRVWAAAKAVGTSGVAWLGRTGWLPLPPLLSSCSCLP